MSWWGCPHKRRAVKMIVTTPTSGSRNLVHVATQRLATPETPPEQKWVYGSTTVFSECLDCGDIKTIQAIGQPSHISADWGALLEPLVKEGASK